MAKRKITPETHAEQVVDVANEALDLVATLRDSCEDAKVDALIKHINRLSVLAAAIPTPVEVSAPPPPHRDSRHGPLACYGPWRPHG